MGIKKNKVSLVAISAYYLTARLQLFPGGVGPSKSTTCMAQTQSSGPQNLIIIILTPELDISPLSVFSF